jgi:hypothetical protein
VLYFNIGITISICLRQKIKTPTEFHRSLACIYELVSTANISTLFELANKKGENLQKQGLQRENVLRFGKGLKGIFVLLVASCLCFWVVVAL